MGKAPSFTNSTWREACSLEEVAKNLERDLIRLKVGTITVTACMVEGVRSC